MKTKKVLSVVLSLILMVCCTSILVSAEDTNHPVISLIGEKQAIIGSEYEVYLNIDEKNAPDTIGGIACDVRYDKDKFTIKKVEISEKFASANNITSETADKVIDTSIEGCIKVVVLQAKQDSNKNNWLTFVFEVKGSATTGDAFFSIENADTSNSTGTDLVIHGLSVNVTKNIFNEMVKVNGASIRKDGTGDIRFEAEIIDITDVAEIGFIMLPTKAVDNGDMTVTADGKYIRADGSSITLATASTTVNKLTSTKKMYCYLVGSAMQFSLDTSFSARAYVKVENNDDNTYTYIYSDNIIVDNGIVGGTSSKSCIDTAKAIIKLYDAQGKDVSSLEGYLDDGVDVWTENYKSIVDKLAELENAN